MAHNWTEAHSLRTTGVQFYWLNNWISHCCKSVEFSLDNSDARYTGYSRSGLRIRFYVIVCLRNGLFFSCTGKRYKTGLQQWRNWRGCKGANLHPGKLIVKSRPLLASVCNIFLICNDSRLFFSCFSEVFGLFSGDLGF